MNEITKLSIKDFLNQTKTMFLAPDMILKEMGDTENYTSIAVPQLFLSMAFIPIAMLLAMLIGASDFLPFRAVISMWLIFAGAIMFYYMLISWGVSKLLWTLRDSMGFEGTEKEFYKLTVLTLSAYFIGNSFFWLISFIGSLSAYTGYLSPLTGAGVAGYVLFKGFGSDFNVDEQKKNVFLGIMIGVPTIAFIFFHLILGSGNMASFH